MIAIIDYDAGNLTSVARAITHLGFKCIITNNIKDIDKAERVIFPGVGAAGSAMESIKRLGLDKAIKDAFSSGKPILAICIGTQIIMEYSEENDTDCLGIIGGKVLFFNFDEINKSGNKLKIPHMGWNSINIQKNHPVLSEVKADDEFYFVHGYYPAPDNYTHVIGTTGYGISFASVIGYKNIIATQFHPEKSGRPGLSILKNFCAWKPC
ncbi:MAG: imidazole glycerol phosphate synthase subunit HisH [Proteobacteria bacterium]|nr:imidazole glycerol phosphate synthase subunit HisH [Pseudomonadota bacterium]